MHCLIRIEKNEIVTMLYIVSSFLILTFSASGLCILCTKFAMVLVEQSKLWGRGRVRKLIPIFICASISLPQIVEMLIYAAEVAPSILVGQPAYGNTMHTVLGWLSSMTFYGTVLQLFVLSLLKAKHITKRKIKFQNSIVKGTIISCWLMGAALTAVVQEKVCHYEMPVDDYFYYQCDNGERNKNIRLATLNGTFCGAILLLTSVSVAQSYWHTKTTVKPSQETETHTSFTMASGSMSQNVPDDNATASVSVNEVLHDWSKCLIFQLILCFIKVGSVLVVLLLKPSIWFGLIETLLQIVCSTLSTYMYLRVLNKISNFMFSVELKNAVRSSLLQFRQWTSRRSLRNSFRESSRSFRETQSRAKNAVKTTSVVVSKSAIDASKSALPSDCFLAKIPDLETHGNEEIPRPGIPVVQVS